MFWKFFQLQTLIDSLFDDSWTTLGLPDVCVDNEIALAE